MPGPGKAADFSLRIFNPDGSEAEKSGNGLRIFGRYLFDRGRLTGRCIVETRGGTVAIEVRQEADGAVRYAVDMGRAAVLFAENCPAEQLLPLADWPHPGIGVSVGNPHWVTFVEDVEAVRPRLSAVGPAIENHPRFPERTNVQFAQVLGPGRVRALIWERGAGETLASGSSACAVAVAGLVSGRLGGEVAVEMDGGTLDVSVSPDLLVRQTGPVTPIAEGSLLSLFVDELFGLE